MSGLSDSEKIPLERPFTLLEEEEEEEEEEDSSLSVSTPAHGALYLSLAFSVLVISFLVCFICCV